MKNNKGFIPVIIVVVVVVAVASYFLINKKPGMIKVPGENGKEVSVKCPYDDSTLCRYFGNAAKMMSFKDGGSIKSITTDKTGQKNEGLIEIQGENSRFLSISNGKETSNIVNYQGTTYMKDMTDGKWIKYENKTKEGDSSKSQFNSESIKENLKKFSEEAVDKLSYKKIGKESCPPYNCFKYQLVMTISPDVTEYVYFDDKEYLLRKTRMENKDGSATEMMYEYKAVKIEKPSPVKENPLDSLMKGGNIDEEKLKELQNQFKQTEDNNQGEINPTESE